MCTMQQQREIALCVPQEFSPTVVPAPSIAPAHSKKFLDEFSKGSGGISFIIFLSIGMMLLWCCIFFTFLACEAGPACDQEKIATILISLGFIFDTFLTLFLFILLLILCCGKSDRIDDGTDQLLRQPRILARVYAPVAAVNLLAIWMVTWYLNPWTMAAILSASGLAFFLVIYSLLSTDRLPRPPLPPPLPPLSPPPSTPAS